MKIGVFDSGIGGLSVAKAIEAALPDASVVFVNDLAHMPYGSKPPQEVLGYVVPILEDLVNQGCQVLVIACNTVTTTLITELRSQFSVPLIGIEPMVKVAAQKTKSNVIAVCATPTTLASSRYQWLKQQYASDLTVLEPDCSDWSAMIEQDQVDQERIKQQVLEVCDSNADIIVLACTHYHWIEEQIQTAAAGRAIVIQPEQAVIAQLKKVIKTL